MGMEEVRTAALVAAKLREWGVEVTEGVGKTGVVGTIRGRLPGQRAIGLRADMDALSIYLEQTGAAHASANAGVMHACGHDEHTLRERCCWVPRSTSPRTAISPAR